MNVSELQYEGFLVPYVYFIFILKSGTCFKTVHFSVDILPHCFYNRLCLVSTSACPIKILHVVLVGPILNDVPIDGLLQKGLRSY